MVLRSSVVVLWALAAAFSARAQCLTGNGVAVTLSEQATISMITVYPGDQIHAYWGHSALRVQDPALGLDLMYNYGAFLFDRAFLPKFIYGKLDYILCVSSMHSELRKYSAREKRSVVEQSLALTAAQRQEVFDFLENNALPENRTYRYDFLFDNCSTRIRDVLEHVLGSSLKYGSLEQVDDDRDKTFRAILRQYVEDLPFLKLGIDLGLGLPVDRQPAPRELMGLPLDLMEAYDRASLDTFEGVQPLVTQKDTLLWIETEAPPSRARYGALYGLVWFVFFAGLWVTNVKGSGASRVRIWFDRLLFAFCGLTGFVAVFLWFVAIHQVTNVNFNLVWAWPTHLLVIPFISEKNNRLKIYMRVCAIVVFIVLLGWYYWPQDMNIALIPVLLTVVVRSAWWGWNPAASRSDSEYAGVQPVAQ